MKNAKKTVAICLAAAFFATVLFSFSALGGDQPKRLSPVNPPWEAGQATLEELHDFFPHGMFWNHVVGDPDEAYSVTDTACSPYLDDEALHDKEAGVTCNFFEVPGKVYGGWQCCGYVRMLTYAYYGVSFENWDTETTLENVKAGDVLALWNYGPHYIYIETLKDNGDGTAAITYADCNGTGKRSHCQIQWDALGTLDRVQNTMKNSLLGDWELDTLYVSPENPAPTTSAPMTATETTTTTVTTATTTTVATTTTTTTPLALSVRYNVCGGEAGSKQYTVAKNGDLCVWETGEPVTDRLTAETVASASPLSAQRAGLTRKGYHFAGWSFDKNGGDAATALAALYPVSSENAALWFAEQLENKARAGLATAFQSGVRQVTLYAVWIPANDRE